MRNSIAHAAATGTILATVKAMIGNGHASETMRTKGYGSDLTDEQWALVQPFIPAPKFGGRPRTTSERDVLDAILYLVRTGCQWRQLPRHFPPWQTVNWYFYVWTRSGAFRQMQRALSLELRRCAGRDDAPTAICIDSQSVKTGKAGGERGYDGGKRVKGRKRHIVVDTNGTLLEACVTPANVHDKVGARKVLSRLATWLKPAPQMLFADGGYDGAPFRNWVKTTIGASMEIAVNLAQKVKQFVPAKKRWVVERTFAWCGDYRRLDKDHERLLCSSLAMIRLAMSARALKRLVAFGLSVKKLRNPLVGGFSCFVRC